MVTSHYQIKGVSIQEVSIPANVDHAQLAVPLSEARPKVRPHVSSIISNNVPQQHKDHENELQNVMKQQTANQTTIPHTELIAAVVAVNVDELTRREFQFDL